MDKHTVMIAELDDDEKVVKYKLIDDCYVCPYDTGDKFADHDCMLTGESLHHSGRHDIDVPESCPFPVVSVDGDEDDGGIGRTHSGIVRRYPGIDANSLAEIRSHIIL